MIITLDGKQEWHGHWTQPGREIHHRLKSVVGSILGCINRGRAAETKKVIAVIYPVLVIPAWDIAAIFRQSTLSKKGVGRLKEKSVFKYQKGYHVRGRLDFYFGPEVQPEAGKRQKSTSLEIKQS